MFLDKFFSSPSYSNNKEAIKDLKRVSGMAGTSNNEIKMKRILEKVEGYIDDLHDHELAYWLGIAWRNYTTWYVRGDGRKEPLKKAVKYFNKAFELSKDSVPNNTDSKSLDRLGIASELGNLLVNEAIIRDLDRAEEVLGFVYQNTNKYKPCLCAYADLFYKKKEYKKCVEIGEKIYDRELGLTFEETPPAIKKIIGKARRKLAKQAKKEGGNEESIKHFRRIKDLGVATDNDLKILNKLQN